MMARHHRLCRENEGDSKEGSMRWKVPEVARALHAPVPAGTDPLARLAGVSIDSRTLVAGQLFIAIQGPHHDGHQFVAAALQTGAPAAVVAEARIAEFLPAIRNKLILVPDTLAALQELARAVRRAWGRRMAAITGSVGKTTTKEILAALLGAKFRVLKSEGNLNNEYGLPLALLRLEPEHEAAVVELGMSHRGELRRLAEIAEPEVGIVTQVAPVHLEFFASIDEIALAKRELIEGLAGPHAVAVLNADDPRVARFAEVARGEVLTFGFSRSAQFRAEQIADRGVEGSSFDFVSPQGRARIGLALPGRHSVANALAALAAASVWGIGAAEAAAVLPYLSAGEMRGRLSRLANGITLINDSYNSNPVALRAMIDLLAGTPGHRRRILAAGEMLELGPGSPAMHRDAGRHAAARKLDWVVGVQGQASALVEGAVEGGLPAECSRFFASSPEAAAFLVDLLQPGDLLLVKGSRGVKMERIVEALRSRHAPASGGTEVPAANPGRL
jgi:UDP-N-acetylmuramoyl-tripeptide--D-alanyl-D-alanine ligase